MRALALLLLLAACGSSATTPDDGATAALDMAAPAGARCPAVQAPLSDFACAPTYAAARALPRCTGVTACGGYDATDDFENGSELTCYYEHASGQLVGAWSFVDDGGCKVAGVGHDACATPTWTSCSGDGGT
jgi:hypothetical protein